MTKNLKFADNVQGTIKRTSTHETGNLVLVKNDQVVTTSLVVSQIFEKRHSDVIRQIQKLILANELLRWLFVSSNYIDEQGKSRVMFVMNRDGFSLLAMGFTGVKALEFKLAYINAFNEMERKLSGITVREDEIINIIRELCADVNSRIKGHEKVLKKEHGVQQAGDMSCLSLLRRVTIKEQLTNIFATLNNNIMSGQFAWAKLEKVEKEHEKMKKSLAGMAIEFLSYY